MISPQQVGGVPQVIGLDCFCSADDLSLTGTLPGGLRSNDRSRDRKPERHFCASARVAEGRYSSCEARAKNVASGTSGQSAWVPYDGHRTVPAWCFADVASCRSGLVSGLGSRGIRTRQVARRDLETSRRNAQMRCRVSENITRAVLVSRRGRVNTCSGGGGCGPALSAIIQLPNIGTENEK